MNNKPEPKLMGYIITALVLHAVVFVVCVFVVPSWVPKPEPKEASMAIQLVGGDLKPVGPEDSTGPAAATEEPTAPPPPKVEEPEPAPPEPPKVVDTPPPDEVIPIGPKDPEPKVIEKIETPPPKPKEPPKPKDPPKPKEPPKPKTPPKPKKDPVQAKIDAMKKNRDAQANESKINNSIDEIRKKQGGAGGQGGPGEGASTEGRTVDPEMARYYQHIRKVIRDNWIKPLDVEPTLRTTYKLTIELNGDISSAVMTRSSGNNDYDLSVERAVNMSTFEPLPDVFGGVPLNINVNLDASEMLSR